MLGIDGMSSYSQKGLQFHYPEEWQVMEDDFDEVIRAITVETPLEGLCMLDLYRTEQAPPLDSYIENQIQHFEETLPFGFKIVEGPTNSSEKASHQGREITGVTVKSTIRTLFRQRIPDVNSFYRIALGDYVGMCSLRCSGDAFSELRPGFLQFLESLECTNGDWV